LLGAILANNRAFSLVSSFLRPEHFCDPIHGTIYTECARLILKGRLADAVTLQSVFSDSGRLAEVGGTAYLAGLLSAMVGIINAAEYGRVIRDCWLRRQLSDVGAAMVTNAYGGGDVDGEGQLQSAVDNLMNLTSGSIDAPLVSLASAAREAIEASERVARGESRDVIYSGFRPLDQLIGGWWNECLYLLGGRPSMGKTTLALQIAIGIARALRREVENAPPFTAAGGQVLVFSLEMPAQQLGGWAACHLAQVPNDIIRGKRVANEQEAFALLEAEKEMATLPVNIIDAVGMSGANMALRARTESTRRRVRFVIVDHIQKVVSALHGERGRGFDTTAETARTTSALKDLSRQLRCPVLALAQLKGDVDQRDNHRPHLGDLLYAGERDADVALFLFRQERYMTAAPPDRLVKESDTIYQARRDAHYRLWDESKDRAEIISEKNRSDTLGSVKVGFDGAKSTFWDLSVDQMGEPPADLWA